jgi:hypothetical protein
MDASVVHHAVLPGLAAGLGYLVNFHFGGRYHSGIDPGPLLLITGLIWDVFIAPVCVIAAFVFLPWSWALLVFPSLLMGVLLGGLLSGVIGDAIAIPLGFAVGFVFAVFQIWQYTFS